MTTATAWVGALAYTVQIYFDFSGYSDMAIGLGRMFGFRLPENFDRPYSAASITDFWRRWHMSLSRWFRDYVYIPLGGNRARRGETYRNLIIVFVATGLWHGANWTFLVWGLYHGALMLVERATGTGAVTATGPALVLRRALTFLLVVVGWVLLPGREHGPGADDAPPHVRPVRVRAARGGRRVADQPARPGARAGAGGGPAARFVRPGPRPRLRPQPARPSSPASR